MSGRVLYLSGDDMRALEPHLLPRITDAMERAFALHAVGETILPEKGFLDLSGHATNLDVRMNAYLAYLGGSHRVCAVKWLAARHGRPPGEPLLEGTVLLSDADSGRTLAVMDAGRLTGLRTAAVTAVVVRRLATHSAKKVVVLGSGEQAFYHGLLLQQTLPGLEEIVVWSPSSARAAFVSEKLSKVVSVALTTTDSLEQALDSSSVVIGTRSSAEPVFKRHHVRNDLVFAHVGTADCELDAVGLFSQVVADDLSAAFARPHSILKRAVDAGHLEKGAVVGLGELLAEGAVSELTPTRSAFFSSLGLAFEDAAAAHLAYSLAIELGIGTVLNPS